jgi:hypothetical protein
MSMYEYTIARNIDLPKLVVEVNTRAAEGWRMVYMSQNATYFYVIMEREKAQEAADSTAA